MTATPEPQAVRLDPAAQERLRRIGGERLLGRIVGLFVVNAPALLADALAARDAGDLEALRHAAHSLKSTCANLGVEPLPAALAALEAAAREGRADDAHAALDALAPALHRAVALVEALRETLPPASAG